MKVHFSQPDYGPTRFTLNLEVEPTLADVVDGVMQFFIFLPCHRVLDGFSASLHFLEAKGKKHLHFPQAILAIASRKR